MSAMINTPLSIINAGWGHGGFVDAGCVAGGSMPVPGCGAAGRGHRNTGAVPGRGRRCPHCCSGARLVQPAALCGQLRGPAGVQRTPEPGSGRVRWPLPCGTRGRRCRRGRLADGLACGRARQWCRRARGTGARGQRWLPAPEHLLSARPGPAKTGGSVRPAGRYRRPGAGPAPERRR
ncbi:hypothetical protein G6F57_021570 [Rhizopus arrhizus]|nr:hypothetical protein G6F57_021570 [Rhizopus arrhizus]